MRIVGGKYRHRLINYPQDMTQTRPTKDRVREAIFSALNNIDDTNVLDLYAGSGAMGLEALSRGAKKVTFVDISALAIQTIKDNLLSLNVSSESYSLIKGRDTDVLTNLKESGQKFDLIFLDPPYEKGEYVQIVNLLKEYDLLSEKAILVLESNRPITLEKLDYQKDKEYHYGEIIVHIYWRSL